MLSPQPEVEEFEQEAREMQSENFEENCLRFLPSEDARGYVVSGLLKTDSTYIEIPDRYRGKPVTGIGDRAFEGCKSLVSVALPASILSIGEKAFSECVSLEEIDIPN